ncbi:lytic murein transglycosylase [Micromonospora sp. WMMD1102]|uniref:lytic transglycosylase domain-containing protein n=1 Tax=Micromonospora sp. WMMD1102 TaxID=3016105 RepID=UPI002415869F|nr:lytic murein transglycosylase [Micromonospora sp. WMMD1102]MDG4791650.1 lytic murein transglycosylase [Micromonospora sp. WMMD1102]
MGNTRRVAEREETSTTRPLRPAAPVFDGPLASSGAAPDPDSGSPSAAVPRPRREPDAPAHPAPEPVETRAEKLDPADAGSTAAGTSDLPPADATPDAPGTAGPAPAEARPAAADAPEPKTADSRPETAGTTEPETADTEPTAAGAARPDAASTASGPVVEKPAERPAGKPDETVIDLDTPATAPARRNRRIRVRFAHAVARWPSPGAVRAWSKRPSGRLTLPALLLFALVATTGAAGAFLLPATARQAGSAQPGAETTPPPASPSLEGFPVAPGGLPSGLPSPPSFGTPSVPAPPWNATGGRPSDVLAGWAAQVGPRVGISPTALQAYGYAEMRVGQTTPSCQLRWTTLAAIGHVESSHGRANGAVLGPNGVAAPEIIGLPLDGNGGRMRIMDTEDGRLDRDATYDRAVGPMQFIPTTWAEIGADADGDGVENPHSIDDAALAAGNYLCKGGRNLSVAADWWSAILSYNDVRPYAQSVFETANRYGTDSRT